MKLYGEFTDRLEAVREGTKRLVQFPTMRKLVMLTCAGCVLGLGPCSSSFAINIFVNGNFEGGNSSFGSDLNYVANPPFGQFQNGVYGIATDPSVWFTYNTWSQMGDHTTGTGKMLIATPNPGNARIWFESANLVAGNTYTFTGWGAWVSTADPNIANLSVNADGIALGTFNLASLSQGTWGKFAFSYTAKTTGPTVFSITDLSASSYGNDFVLDDLSLASTVPVPEPGMLAQLLVGFGGMTFLLRRRK